MFINNVFKGNGSSRGFRCLSCYLSIMFKRFDTKWNKNITVDQILGGGGAPPLNPPLMKV